MKCELFRPRKYTPPSICVLQNPFEWFIDHCSMFNGAVPVYFALSSFARMLMQNNANHSILEMVALAMDVKY